VREVRYARDGTDGVMHVYARTRELSFSWELNTVARGARTAREVGVADAGTNGH